MVKNKTSSLCINSPYNFHRNNNACTAIMVDGIRCLFNLIFNALFPTKLHCSCDMFAFFSITFNNLPQAILCVTDWKWSWNEIYSFTKCMCLSFPTKTSCCEAYFKFSFHFFNVQSCLIYSD